MIHFAIALHCEAQSLIHHYRMKPCGGHGRAQFFEGEKARLAVTGLGSLSSAIATTAMGERFPNTSPMWLNIGICGHESAEIGQAFIANKISSDSTKECFYPQLAFKSPWLGTEVKTLRAPSISYEPEKAYDMEAYGFYTAAVLFSSAERVHCVKIVSDNATQTANRSFDKNAITNLIATQIPAIEEFVAALENLRCDTNPSSWITAFTQKTKSVYTLTVTEKHQLKRRVQQLDLLLNEKEKKKLLATLFKLQKTQFLGELQDLVDAGSAKRVCR